MRSNCYNTVVNFTNRLAAAGGNSRRLLSRDWPFGAVETGDADMDCGWYPAAGANFGGHIDYSCENYCIITRSSCSERHHVRINRAGDSSLREYCRTVAHDSRDFCQDARCSNACPPYIVSDRNIAAQVCTRGACRRGCHHVRLLYAAARTVIIRRTCCTNASKQRNSGGVRRSVLSIRPSTSPILRFRASLPERLQARTGLAAANCSLLISLLFGGTDVAASGAGPPFFELASCICWPQAGPMCCWSIAVLSPSGDIICRRLPAPRLLRVIGSTAATWLFVAICGSQPSIVRAGCMSTYRLVGQALGRTSPLFDRLLFAAYVMVLWQPAVWRQPGTWLSFAATYAVGLGIQSQRRDNSREKVTDSSAVRNWLYRVFQGGVRLMKTTLVVELMTLPFLLHWFGQLSTVSVLANLMAEPITMLLLPAILLLIVLTALPSWGATVLVAHWLARAVAVLLHGLLFGSKALAAWPVSFLLLPNFTWSDVSAWYLALFLSIRFGFI